MKRSDLNYGNSRATPQHRIITSTQNAPPAIQYQIANVLKNDANNPMYSYSQPITAGACATIVSKSNINPNQTAQVHVLTTGMAPTAPRHKNTNNAGPVNVTTQSVPAPVNVPNVTTATTSGNNQAQFQRLKVEDALSYLDQVKYKFGSQPQVYNDFLDIMKEFKSQTIDTPGVIQRVSNLFKGHPELIVGFNTFLPPGYKIEVQANDQGYAFQVSVSIPSPSGNVSVQTQASPQHKMQILQGSHSIVQTIPSSAAVNLITQHQSLHIQPQSNQNQQVQAPPPQQQPQQQQQPVSHIPAMIPQNYSSRDTEHISHPSKHTQPAPQRHQQQSQQVSQSVQNQTQQHQQQQVQPTTNANNHQIQPSLHSPSDIGANVGSMIQRMTQPLQPQSDQNQNQPVEFNHAISYVNKIKNRFQNQPEKYKRFLEILHTYQKEQKITKDLSGNIIGEKQLTEAEVYTQVAKLFDNQEDLLREFGQFLPDATSHPVSVPKSLNTVHVQSNKKSSDSGISSVTPNSKQNIMGSNSRVERMPTPSNPGGNVPNMSNTGIRDLSNAANSSGMDFHNASNEKEQFFHPSYNYPREKEPKSHNKIQLNPLSQTQNSTAAGIKRSPTYGIQYINMGRNADRAEPPIKRHKPIGGFDVSLADAAKYGSLNDFAFFDKVRQALRSPDVYDNFLRCLILYNQEIVSKSELLTLVSPFLSKHSDLLRWFQDFLGPPTTPESLPMVAAQRQEQHRAQGDLATEIDLSQCKRLGASYCALPKSNIPKKCSGRTALCREVLNDTWVSFPTWAEDSTFVTSRKTQYEEFIYRCEDERFELDVVIETNSATIRVLEGVQKKLSRMTPEEVNRFKLDDTLGGTSQTIHQRALRRIYGDKAGDIIQGLKKNPVVAVPVVLRRLKAKEEEWREAQKGFNKQWREQNEKYYLKSLDHQGINFKQNDIKALRSKSLFNEIETLFDERNDEVAGEHNAGPHLVLRYKDKSILDDAANLLIHHVKRQTGSQKQEKARIKHILRQFVPDLFFSPRQPLSDDEREDEVFPFSVDDRDEPLESKGKPSSANSDVSATSSTNTPFSVNNNNNNNTSLNEKSSKTSAASDTDQDMKRKSSNESSSSHQENSENLNSSQNVNSSQLNQSSEKKDENAQDSSSKTNAELDIKTEIKEENETTTTTTTSSKTKSKSFSTQRLQHAISKHPEEAYTLFFANNNWYLFFRLHAILCERLIAMYERTQILASEEEQHKSNRRNSTAISLRLKPQSELEIPDYYPAFLDLLKNLLDGNVDSNTYEDKLRDMYGIHAYIAFTLDRVVSNAVRQLQHCVTERSALDCVELFQLESRKNAAGGLCRTASKRLASEMSYQRRAEANLSDENCYKIFIYKYDCRVTIELLDNESEDATSNPVSSAQDWGTYVERLANPAHSNPMTTNIFLRTPVFLQRNIRNFNKRNLQKIKAAAEKNNTENSKNNTSSSNEVPSTDPTAANKTNDSVWGNKNAAERVGANNNSDYYVDDNQQIKLNINTYKMIFLSSDFGFYKKNAIRRSRQIHPKVTKSKHRKFSEFVQKWVNKNSSELQRITLNDWLLGRQQCDQIPNRTSVRRDNNLNCIPYYSYNRYTVEFLNNNS